MRIISNVLGILVAVTPIVSLAAPVDEQAGAPDEKAPSIASLREDLMRGMYAQVLEACDKFSNDKPDFDDIRPIRAEALRRTGRYDEAIQVLLAPVKNAESRRLVLLGDVHRVVGRYDDALSTARQAVQADPNDPSAHRLLGEIQELLGRRDEAIKTYRWFEERIAGQDELPRSASWLTDAAFGYVRYSILTQTSVPSRIRFALHDMLQPAYERIDRTYSPARIAAGDLLRERYNNSEEDGSVADYLAALRANPHAVEAIIGIGEVALTYWDFEKAEEQANQALTVNPNEPRAFHLLAAKLILERRYAQAQETADKALAINPRDVVALSIRAAAAACRYDQATVDALRDRVFEINPRCALYHRTLGDALGGIRQYAASEREYLAAIEMDSTDANARAELGLMYMQWGDEAKARSALDAAWTIDSFNQRTKFTLDLLESLDKFAKVESAHFIVRHDEEKDPGLGTLVAECLEDLHAEVEGDYEGTLDTKTIIEIFPTLKSFAVRITGKPWIHTVGACTGRVIALTSPRPSPDTSGPYNLAHVLRHEYTHTVTLAATHNRIPHWFTEGLAVHQENSPKSFQWCEMLVDAIRNHRLFTLESIDWGFIRPRRPNDRQLAYAQSEWMCEFIIDRFGYDAIDKMLRLHRDGIAPAEVMRQALGIAPDEFDPAFAEWAAKDASGWGFDLSPPEDADSLRASIEASPGDAALHGRLAKAEWDQGQVEAAVDAARKATELNADEARGLEVLGTAFTVVGTGQEDSTARERYYEKAVDALTRLARVNPKSVTAPKMLAQIWLQRNEPDKAMPHLLDLQRLCPVDPTSWRGLAGIYLQRGEPDKALPQLVELTRVDDDDAEARVRLAILHRDASRLGEARFWFRQAVYITPYDVEIQEALGDLHRQTGEFPRALARFLMLTKLAASESRYWEKAAFTAHELGDIEQAKTLAAKAVALNPDSKAASLLK